MLLPDAGSVRVGGFDSRHDGSKVRPPSRDRSRNRAFLFPRLSARENLNFFAALDEVHRRERPRRIEEVLIEAGLKEQADTLAMKFSSGMYQRLGWLAPLSNTPAVLLLDEPTRSLDAAATSNSGRSSRAGRTRRDRASCHA